MLDPATLPPRQLFVLLSLFLRVLALNHPAIKHIRLVVAKIWNSIQKNFKSKTCYRFKKLVNNSLLDNFHKINNNLI